MNQLFLHQGPCRHHPDATIASRLPQTGSWTAAFVIVSFLESLPNRQLTHISRPPECGGASSAPASNPNRAGAWPLCIPPRICASPAESSVVDHLEYFTNGQTP